MSRTRTLDSTVAQVLTQAPRATRVFVRRAMSCPGCVMAHFETVREVAAVYAQEPEGLADEIDCIAGVRA